MEKTGTLIITIILIILLGVYGFIAYKSVKEIKESQKSLGLENMNFTTLAKVQIENKCSGLECFAYCNEESNQEECAKWCLENKEDCQEITKELEKAGFNMTNSGMSPDQIPE